MTKIFILRVETCLDGDILVSTYPHMTKQGAISHMNEEVANSPFKSDCKVKEEKENSVYLEDEYGRYLYVEVIEDNILP